MSTRVRARIVVQPGLEMFTDDELRRLGVQGTVRHGGVDVTMTTAQLLQCHLWLRTATRVLVRVGEFPATTWDALEHGIGRVDWEQYLSSDFVRVRSDAHASKLFHTGAIAERVAAAIEAVTGAVATTDASAGGEGDGSDDGVGFGAQRVLDVRVRIANDRVMVSVDASGGPLYKRGYRLQVAKAPLRESLAAALVMASNWDGRSPLFDPLCGSGTIAIEAALIAQRRAPGRSKEPACAAWPLVDGAAWERLCAAADADVLARRPVVLGRDRDAGAIEAAQANAARAGVEVDFEVAALSVPVSASFSGRKRWIVTNPPYGDRISREMDLRNLYDVLGRQCTAPQTDWAVVAPPGPLISRLGSGEIATRTDNGGTSVVFAIGPAADGSSVTG